MTDLLKTKKTNLDEKISFGKIRKMPVRDLYENREFHILFWSMIYVTLKFTLSVSGKKIIDQNGMWNPHFQACRLPEFSNFWVYRMRVILPNQIFSFKFAFE